MMIRTRHAAPAGLGLSLLLLLPILLLLQPTRGFVAPSPSAQRLPSPLRIISTMRPTTMSSAVPGDMEPGGLGSRQARRQSRFNKAPKPEGAYVADASWLAVLTSGLVWFGLGSKI